MDRLLRRRFRLPLFRGSARGRGEWLVRWSGCSSFESVERRKKGEQERGHQSNATHGDRRVKVWFEEEGHRDAVGRRLVDDSVQRRLVPTRRVHLDHLSDVDDEAARFRVGVDPGAALARVGIGLASLRVSEEDLERAGSRIREQKSPVTVVLVCAARYALGIRREGRIADAPRDPERVRHPALQARIVVVVVLVLSFVEIECHGGRFHEGMSEELHLFEMRFEEGPERGGLRGPAVRTVQELGRIFFFGWEGLVAIPACAGQSRVGQLAEKCGVVSTKGLAFVPVRVSSGHVLAHLLPPCERRRQVQRAFKDHNCWDACMSCRPRRLTASAISALDL